MGCVEEGGGMCFRGKNSLEKALDFATSVCVRLCACDSVRACACWYVCASLGELPDRYAPLLLTLCVEW